LFNSFEYFGLLFGVYDLIFIFIVAHLELSHLFFTSWLSLLCGDHFFWLLQLRPDDIGRKIPRSIENKPVPRWGNPQSVIDIVFVNFSCSVHLLMSSGV